MFSSRATSSCGVSSRAVSSRAKVVLFSKMRKFCMKKIKASSEPTQSVKLAHSTLCVDSLNALCFDNSHKDFCERAQGSASCSQSSLAVARYNFETLETKLLDINEKSARSLMTFLG